MLAVTTFSKLLEGTEMCAYSIFFFKAADTTDTLNIKAFVNPTVFKKKIELAHIFVSSSNFENGVTANIFSTAV